MRWIVWVGVVLAVLVVGTLGLSAMVPADRVAQALSAQFEAMTGRTLALEGEVKPRLWPSLGITTGPGEHRERRLGGKRSAAFPGRKACRST